MKIFFCIYILFINHLIADEPVAIIAKTKGDVKYKLESENKYHSNIHENEPIYLNSRIQTQKKSFSKIIYLDDASIISIYPESEIKIEGIINDRIITKNIQVIRGSLWINIDTNSEEKFKLITEFTELTCKECSLWVLSEKSTGDQFISETGKVELYNPSVNRTIELLPGFTVISNDKLKFEKTSTHVTDIQFLESLMLNADEKSIEYRKKESSDKKDISSSNVIVIKLKNAANIERKIILTYTQNNDIIVE